MEKHHPGGSGRHLLWQLTIYLHIFQILCKQFHHPRPNRGVQYNVSLLFTVQSTTSLKRRSLFFTSSPNSKKPYLWSRSRWSLVKTFCDRACALRYSTVGLRYSGSIRYRFTCEVAACRRVDVLKFYCASLTRRLCRRSIGSRFWVFSRRKRVTNILHRQTAVWHGIASSWLLSDRSDLSDRSYRTA